MEQRAAWAARLPVLCAKCGLPVLPTQRWHLGHQRDRALGGTDDPGNIWPEHGRCNESAGGRLGQAMRRPSRRPVPPDVRRRAW